MDESSPYQHDGLEQYLSSGADLHCRQLYTYVCAPIHILTVMAALYSPFQHAGYPTTRSVEELEDTSTLQLKDS